MSAPSPESDEQQNENETLNDKKQLTELMFPSVHSPLRTDVIKRTAGEANGRTDGQSFRQTERQISNSPHPQSNIVGVICLTKVISGMHSVHFLFLPIFSVQCDFTRALNYYIENIS